MLEIDARGISCPLPVIKTKKAMDSNPGSVLNVLVDNETARENIARLAAYRGYSMKETKTSGEYLLTITPPEA